MSKRHPHPIVGAKFTILDTNQGGVVEDPYSTDIARRALILDSPPQKESTMASPSPAPQPVPYEILLSEINKMQARISEHQEELNNAGELIANLIERIEKLENNRPAGRTPAPWQPDALDYSIIEKLRHVYPMLVDGIALVSAGVDAADSTIIRRCVTLAEHGMIEMEVRSIEGAARKRRRFRALPEKS
jgi:hypothetical protein